RSSRRSRKSDPLVEMPSKAGGPADCGSGCNRTIERHMSECITQLYLAHCQHLRAQEQKHLAQADGHIAELMVQIVRQRVIVKYALDARQRAEPGESLLNTLKKTLALFEKHRKLFLNKLRPRPSE